MKIQFEKEKTPLELRIEKTVKLLREYADYREEAGIEGNWWIRYLADEWEHDGASEVGIPEP